MSILISISLVLFNKFKLGDIVHHIVDTEKWSNKTKLNISFAKKLTLVFTLFKNIYIFLNYTFLQNSSKDFFYY